MFSKVVEKGKRSKMTRLVYLCRRWERRWEDGCQPMASGSPRRSGGLRHEMGKQIPWMRRPSNFEEVSCWNRRESVAGQWGREGKKVKPWLQVTYQVVRVEEEEERPARACRFGWKGCGGFPLVGPAQVGFGSPFFSSYLYLFLFLFIWTHF